MHQRQQLVAESEDGGVLDTLDAVFGVGAGAHQFDHGQLRNGKTVAAGLHDQRRDDRQGQRDLDGDGGAFTGHRLDVDGAADLVDIGTHHIHADAAAGDRGDGRAVEKPGAKMNLWIWASVIFSSSDSLTRPFWTRLRLDPLGVEPAAVVGDADDDVAAFMIGGEADGALLRLAGGGALGRGLQSVIGGIAHHVGERILDQVEHLAIEFGVGAVHLQLDLLAQFAREVAHDPGQLLPGIADRLHPRLHDAFLQLGGDVGQPLQRHLELGVLVATGNLQQLIAGQHQFRDHRHQMFEGIDVDPDRLIGDLVAFGHLGLHGRFLHRLAGFLVAVLLGRGCGFRRRRNAGCGRHFDRGLLEGTLQFIQRDFAGTQFALQGLRHQDALGNFGDDRGDRSGGNRRR